MQRKLDNPYFNGEAPDENMVLMTIGRSPNLLRALLDEARSHYLASESRKTTVFTVNSANYQKCWDHGRSRASRDISTVIMEDKDKDLILRDTREYLNPVTARWYAARGLPYRRGYLFYGPPGTGKTSLTLALAGELKLNLYIFNLGIGGGVSDETLGTLFQALPRKCIVLLEDIDCAGIERDFEDVGSSGFDTENETDHESEDSSSDERSGTKRNATKGKETSSGTRPGSTIGGTAARGTTSPTTLRTGSGSKSTTQATSQPKKSIPKRQQPKGGHVSFSGLLNAIDGVASHEGRILIMTTNHIERLDPALIRPGRVDVQIEFGYAKQETTRRVFTELYKGLGDLPMELSAHVQQALSQREGTDTAATSDAGADFSDDPIYQPSPLEQSTSSLMDHEFMHCGAGKEMDVEALAQRFASRVPEGIFTPAELQGFLMMRKHYPQRAIMEINEWIMQKLIEKKNMRKGTGGTRKKARAELRRRKLEEGQVEEPIASPPGGMVDSWVMCERVREDKGDVSSGESSTRTLVENPVDEPEEMKESDGAVAAAVEEVKMVEELKGKLEKEKDKGVSTGVAMARKGSSEGGLASDSPSPSPKVRKRRPKRVTK